MSFHDGERPDWPGINWEREEGSQIEILSGIMGVWRRWASLITIVRWLRKPWLRIEGKKKIQAAISYSSNESDELYFQVGIATPHKLLSKVIQ